MPLSRTASETHQSCHALDRLQGLDVWGGLTGHSALTATLAGFYAASMTSTALEFSGLSKSFGRVQALTNVSLAVRQGEVFGFLGPNGAGKSTAIRILFDLIRPGHGSASVLGHDCQADGAAARALMGYVPGDLRLYEDLTGRELIALFSSLRAVPADPAFVTSLCERLTIDPTRKVGTLSRGNRQKLGLLLAMMHRPRLLVLDEPTSGLDPLVQEEVAGLIAEHAAAGNTVFFSSHVLSEVERMCSRVGFIRHGNLIAVEEVAQLKGRSLHILEVTFASDVDERAFALPGVRSVSIEGRRIRLEVQDGIDAVLKVIAQYPVLDLRTEQPSLEEIFLAFYQDEHYAHGEPAVAT